MKLLQFITGGLPPLVEQSLDTLGAMLDTSAEMFDAATACLLDNATLDADLSAMDERINEGERAIRRMLLEHLAVDPRRELALSLLVLSVVQDAERCGDLAKSIAKAADLSARARMGPHVSALQYLRDRVQKLFPAARTAVLLDDASRARTVMEVHDRLKQDGAAYLQALAASSTLSANDAVVLGTTARMIGRVSSHLSNIASSVAMPFDEVRCAPSWNATRRSGQSA